MILSFITWDVTPEIFTLPADWFLVGGLSVRWYGLLFAMSFVFGYIIMKKIFDNENISEKVLDQLSTYMLIFTIVGARLGHCLFYEPGYYLSNPIEILKVWEGGLASHGAAVGILLGLFFFAKANKKPYLWVLDRIVIVVALAGFFIRTGNLMNSEIFGDVTTLPWGFIFTRYYDPALAIDPRHPTQIYEALSYLLIFIFLYRTYWKSKGKTTDGEIFGYFLSLLFSVRFLIEFIKVPQVGFEENMILNMGQLLSIPFVLAGLYLLYRARKSKA
ncbi:MAG: prolipoprotein diacylglyceryl transferase [Chlorobi bacterium]|nr:prolipoprotein diacylglyceryl transferase [Chlorobiota bacterium]